MCDTTGSVCVCMANKIRRNCALLQNQLNGWGKEGVETLRDMITKLCRIDWFVKTSAQQAASTYT